MGSAGNVSPPDGVSARGRSAAQAIVSWRCSRLSTGYTTLTGDAPDEIGDTLTLSSPTIRDRIGGIVARLGPLGSAG